MNRFTQGLLIVLVLGAVVLGGFLPALAGNHMDAASRNRCQTAEVRDMDWELDVQASVRERVAAFSKGSSWFDVVGTAEKPEGKEEELRKIFAEAMDDLRTLGLIREEFALDNVDHFFMDQEICYTPLRPHECFLSWRLCMYNENKSSLTLYIDDATGKIFRMDYLSATDPAVNYSGGRPSNSRFLSLVRWYYDGLGEEFQDEYAQCLTVELGEQDTIELVHTWTDETVGEVVNGFHMYPGGYGIFLS